MALEIERKFTIKPDFISSLSGGTRIVQAYLSTQVNAVVRARILGKQAFITIKGKNKGAVRQEFEYEIPKEDAETMIRDLCDQVIEKVRYCVDHGKHVWEVDVFEGDNQGLVIAEVELQEENEEFILPDWVEKEVTDDIRYYNSNLITKPFKSW